MGFEWPSRTDMLMGASIIMPPILMVIGAVIADMLTRQREREKT